MGDVKAVCRDRAPRPQAYPFPMNLLLAAILIPILYNGPGQHGSHWYTNVVVNHHGTQPLEGRGIVFLDVSCPIPEGCPAGNIEQGVGFVIGPQSGRGLLLHPSEGDEDRVYVQAHFGEQRRHANTGGVELPVARDDDFRTHIGLPAVRLDGGHETPAVRTQLRIYSLDPSPGQHVRVEMRGWHSPTAAVPEAVQVITLNAGDTLHPAFAELDLQRAFPQVHEGAVRVDVVAIPDGDHTPLVWAFVTMTHSATNEVTVISPQ